MMYDDVSVCCFAGKDRWALTDDDSGHALPAERPQGTRSELRVQRKGEGPILASWPAPAPSTRRYGPIGRCARPTSHSEAQRPQVALCRHRSHAQTSALDVRPIPLPFLYWWGTNLAFSQCPCVVLC